MHLPAWPMPPAASNSASLDSHLSLNLWIAAALFTLAHLILFIGLALHRQTRAQSTLLVEYLPVTLLALIFAGLTIHSERLWAASRYAGPSPAALQVEATGMQFAWYFRYPGKDYTFGRARPELVDPGAGNPLGLDPSDSSGHDDIVTSELVLPADREVDVHLHAQDVIHGFSVPAMRVKQNAVPGQSLHIHFTPHVPGTYAILCTQLCGLGHFRMSANLRVLTPEDFARWIAARQAARP